MNLADRLYLAYFAGLGLLILLLRDRVPGWPGYLALHLVLIALVIGLAFNARRFPTAHAWYPWVLPLLTFQEVAQLNFLLVDDWQDHYLLAFESWLFAEPPTVWLSRFASPLVTEILEIGYLSYFFLLPIVAGVLYQRRDKAPFFGVMAATVLAYMLCYVVFLIFPTEGPAHTLRDLHTVPLPGGPFHALVMFVQRAGVHGNAFPSAHVAGAMVALIFAWRHLPTLAAWLTPLVVLLCIGAVYDRYHYASDIFGGLAVGAAACITLVRNTRILHCPVIIWCLAQPLPAAAQTVMRISDWPDGAELRLASFHRPLISPNGRLAVFLGVDIWVKDLESRVLERILTPRNPPGAAWFSADSRSLAFVAGAELFVLDLSSRELVLVEPPDGVDVSGSPSAVSADLRWLVYRSAQGLVLYDRLNALPTVIPGGSATDASASISDDGRRVLFRRTVTRLEPNHVLVYDRVSRTVERVDTGAPTLDGHSLVFNVFVSGDGRYVAFDALCIDCGDSIRRLFARDLEWRRTWELVRGIDGLPPDRGGIDLRGINRDGRFVLFESGSGNLVPGDPLFGDVFVADRVTGAIGRLNGDIRGGSTSFVTSSSADGLRVAFALPPLLTRFPASSPSIGPIYLSSRAGDGGIQARFRFRTRAAAVNPDTSRLIVRNRTDTPASVWLRLVDGGGLSSVYRFTVASRATRELPLTEIPDRPRDPFTLHLESDVPVAAGLSTPGR